MLSDNFAEKKIKQINSRIMLLSEKLIFIKLRSSSLRCSKNTGRRKNVQSPRELIKTVELWIETRTNSWGIFSASLVPYVIIVLTPYKPYICIVFVGTCNGYLCCASRQLYDVVIRKKISRGHEVHTPGSLHRRRSCARRSPIYLASRQKATVYPHKHPISPTINALTLSLRLSNFQPFLSSFKRFTHFSSSSHPFE